MMTNKRKTKSKKKRSQTASLSALYLRELSRGAREGERMQRNRKIRTLSFWTLHRRKKRLKKMSPRKRSESFKKKRTSAF